VAELLTTGYLHRVRSLIAFALVLAACRGSDRSPLPASGAVASPPRAQRGPDALVLRAPRKGGVPRVTGYPNVDSTVWSGTDAMPALDHVLAFDADAGLIAAVDARGYPLWLDLNLGTITIPNRGKLRGLASVDGSTIYGVGADGAVVRFTPSGNSVYKLPKPARAVFPQVNGTLLVRSATGDSVWIVGIGSHAVVGTVRSQWRSDLPFVAADGAIAIIDGRDVAFVDAVSGKEIRRAAGGSDDFWYPFVWSGLRPRAAALDQQVPLPTDSDTIVKPPAPVDTTKPPAPPAPSPDSAKTGFTVSFAALLDASKARDAAAKIVVNGQAARVVTNVTDGTAVYRVVLGPFPTREEADRAGRASGQAYYVYAGSP
jgi:hypothetical protein